MVDNCMTVGDLIAWLKLFNPADCVMVMTADQTVANVQQVAWYPESSHPDHGHSAGVIISDGFVAG
jgi:hypothetical protein